MPVNRLWGIGKVTGKLKMSIETIGQLAACDTQDSLQGSKNGTWLKKHLVSMNHL